MTRSDRFPMGGSASLSLDSPDVILTALPCFDFFSGAF